MASQLFREQALSHQGERHWGDSIDSSPPGLLVFTFLLLFIFAASVWFLATGDYRRKQAVIGILVPDKGSVLVKAPVQGVVEQLQVAQGDRIRRGDVLLVIQSDLAAVQGEAMGKRLLEENERQRRILKKLIEDERDKLVAKRGQLGSRLAGLDKEHKQLEGLIRNEEAVAALLKQKFERVRRLYARELAAMADLETVHAELLKEENTLQQYRLDMAGNNRQQEEARQSLELLALESRESVNRLENELADIDRRKLQLMADRSVQVLSPVDGVVGVVHHGEGQMVSQQQTIISIIHADSKLEAEIYVPSRAIGFIEAGQAVNIRFDAFPYQKFGSQKAEVREISRSILLPADMSGGIRLKEPAYRIKAGLEEQLLSAYGRNLPLKPGMQFSADIILESRTLLQWLFDPLLSMGRR